MCSCALGTSYTEMNNRRFLAVKELMVHGGVTQSVVQIVTGLKEKKPLE